MVKAKELQVKAKALEEEYGINYYELLQRFMFERILERISISDYQDNFILKGGLLLMSMFGVNNRTTKDMDTTIKGIDVSKEKMIVILNEILSINLHDGVKFDIVDITDIREDDEYDGNKYHIVGKIENLKINLEIDISTGDKVTPKELKYKYPCLFAEKEILISSYNYETMLSEKIETILRRGKFNSRMKDYYDVYMFLTKLKDKINVKVLKEAMDNTFNRRDSFCYLNDYNIIIDSIIGDKRMKGLWIKYMKKNEYAKDIDFDEILYLLKEYINKLEMDIILV